MKNTKLSKSKTKTKVLLAMSGGVDSSVAALLLQKQGYEIIGAFMKNWSNTKNDFGECAWRDERRMAMKIANMLNIPLITLDFEKQYKKEVVQDMFNNYKKGITPNPDVICNNKIKFPLLWKEAKKRHCDFVSTGHYARIKKTNKGYFLLRAKAENKDQSYFLCQLSQEQLAKSLFPIGELTKPEVREIAAQMDLVTADKKDSQGLCFIGKVRLPEFLQQKLQAKEGSIIQIDKNFPIYNTEKPVFNSEIEALAFEAKSIDYTPEMGKLVGKHQGAHYFTNGQRKGLGVGGTTEPLFIIATNVKTNTVYTGLGSQHPGLFKKALFIEKSEVHWIREDLALANGETMEVMARIRYRQPLQKATLHQFKNGMYVSFEEPQSAITEGQFVAWYFDDELVGSGVIS